MKGFQNVLAKWLKVSTTNRSSGFHIIHNSNKVIRSEPGYLEHKIKKKKKFYYLGKKLDFYLGQNLNPEIVVIPGKDETALIPGKSAYVHL